MGWEAVEGYEAVQIDKGTDCKFLLFTVSKVHKASGVEGNQHISDDGVDDQASEGLFVFSYQCLVSHFVW